MSGVFLIYHHFCCSGTFGGKWGHVFIIFIPSYTPATYLYEPVPERVHHVYAKRRRVSGTVLYRDDRERAKERKLINPRWHRKKGREMKERLAHAGREVSRIANCRAKVVRHAVEVRIGRSGVRLTLKIDLNRSHRSLSSVARTLFGRYLGPEGREEMDLVQGVRIDTTNRGPVVCLT